MADEKINTYPLISEHGIELRIRLRCDEAGVYTADASTHYDAPPELQASCSITTHGMEAIDALTRIAPQLGEAIRVAEMLHERAQIARYHQSQCSHAYGTEGHLTGVCLKCGMKLAPVPNQSTCEHDWLTGTTQRRCIKCNLVCPL